MYIAKQYRWALLALILIAAVAWGAYKARALADGTNHVLGSNSTPA